MAFRMIAGALQGKYHCGIPSNASSNYLPLSSDAGKLIMLTSNTVCCLSGSSDAALNSTDAAGNYRLAGIFVKPEYENDASSCSTFGSTACKLWYQPVLDGDILEVDYSTQSSNLGTADNGVNRTSGTTGDFHTTNIGMYYKVCYSSDSTTAVAGGAPVNTAYLNASTGTAIKTQATGRVFKLIDYSSKAKTATVVYDSLGYST